VAHFRCAHETRDSFDFTWRRRSGVATLCLRSRALILSRTLTYSGCLWSNACLHPQVTTDSVANFCAVTTQVYHGGTRIGQFVVLAFRVADLVVRLLVLSARGISCTTRWRTAFCRIASGTCIRFVWWRVELVSLSPDHAAD